MWLAGMPGVRCRNRPGDVYEVSFWSCLSDGRGRRALQLEAMRSTTRENVTGTEKGRGRASLLRAGQLYGGEAGGQLVERGGGALALAQLRLRGLLRQLQDTRGIKRMVASPSLLGPQFWRRKGY